MKAASVIIVGAGPVGLTLALECSRRKVPFRIFDEAPKPVEKSGAVLLWSNIQEIFSALGISNSVQQTSWGSLEGVRVCSPHRILKDVFFAKEVDSPYPLPLVVQQSQVEAIMLAELTSAGHAVERSLEFISLEQDEQRVKAVFIDHAHDDEKVTVEGDYLVGCDGAQSAVRHAVGISFGKSPPSECFILCDARVRGMETAIRSLHLFTSSAGPLTMFPLHGDYWRIISSRGEGAGTALPTTEEMQEHLDMRCGPRGIVIENAERFHCSRIIERRITRFRDGRVLLAGDAAHVHNLATAQGMNVGVRDAYNLAWKLDAVLRRQVDAESALGSYAIERENIVDRIIAKTQQLMGIVFLSRYPFGGFPALFAGLALGCSPENSIANVLAAVKSRYKNPGPLISDDHLWHEDWRDYGFMPGQRVRDAVLQLGNAAGRLLPMVMDAMAGTFLLFSGREPRADDVDAIEMFASVAQKHFPEMQIFKIWRGAKTPGEDWISDSDCSLHRRFGVDFCAGYFIRPDGVVASRSQPLNIEMLPRQNSEIKK